MKKRPPDLSRKFQIKLGSGNVYVDLGLADSEGMLVKAQLVTEMAEILKQRRLTQQQAAKTLHLTQPRVSRLLRGEFRGFSERRLLRCLIRLGRDVQIIVKQAPRHRARGRLSVRFA
jgi:predicted XRE-type DNA-binding protein